MTTVLAPPRRGLLWAAVLLTAATRLAYLLGPAMQFNADEATTGIMVRRILAGHGYVYYAGQAYGGALEQYVEALVYAVTRLPQNELTLRLPLVALCMATCVLVHRVAGDVVDDPVRPLVAAGLYAVSPWFNVIGTVTSLGFYAVGQTLSIAVLWCALRSGRGPRWLFATGLCAGLGLWTAATALYVLIPVFLWLVPVAGRDARRWGPAAAGAVLGALPMLGSLAVHRTLPLPPDPAEPTGVLDRLGNLFGPILRQYVGVTYAHAEGGLWLPVQVAVVAGLVAAYLVALVRRRGGLLDLVRGRMGRRRPGDLLLAVPPVVLVLWAASDTTWYTGTPRYLVGTFPLLAIGLAALVPTHRPVVPVVAVLACAALSAGFFPTIRASHTRDGDEVLRQVTAVLVAERHTDVYAGYWTATPLQYIAGDRLVVATAIGVRRFPAAQAEVERAAAPVWVGSDHDGTTAVIRAALDRGGVPYRVRRFGFLTVFDQLPATADPAALGL
jgi:4-amino-4-deoxy-L-arabinose transferase-like glycosyltransferase